jgi:HNH endonuclease
MDAALERLVRRRASGRCEYCRLPQASSRFPFEIDHIRPRKHYGRTVAGNLALSCVYYNAYKGPNLSGIDPITGGLTTLFHPRRHKWAYHFPFDGGRLSGRTAIGRTTIDVLRINLPNRVAIREVLIEDGIF